jgi:rubrerythrin
LKTEIRKLRSRYNLYLEKTHEILLVCEEESKKYEDKKETFSRKGTINSMRETFTSTFHMSHHQAKDSTGLEEEAEKLLGDDQLQTNLNKIRNLIREMSNTVRLRKNLILQISKEYEFKKEEKQNILKENILKENILGDIEQLKNEIRPQTDAINNLAFNCKAEEPRTNEQTNDTPTNGVSELVNLVEKVPRLIPEEFVQRCQGCEVNFGLCTWKYHCRVCGFVFCFYCSWNFDNFLPFYMYAVRICNKCVASKKNKCYLKNM